MSLWKWCRAALLLLALAVAGGALADGGNLRVTVRVESQSQSQNASGGVGWHGAGAYGNQRNESSSSEQFLVVMDGGEAGLNVGETRPIRLRQIIRGLTGEVVSESLVLRSLGSRLRILPKSRGDRVVATVVSEDARPIPNLPGAAQVLELSTTVSGAWGDWLEIGGGDQSRDSRSQGLGTGGFDASQGAENNSRRILLRFDPLP